MGAIFMYLNSDDCYLLLYMSVTGAGSGYSKCWSPACARRWWTCSAGSWRWRTSRRWPPWWARSRCAPRRPSTTPRSTRSSPRRRWVCSSSQLLSFIQLVCWWLAIIVLSYYISLFYLYKRISALVHPRTYLHCNFIQHCSILEPEFGILKSLYALWSCQQCPSDQTTLLLHGTSIDMTYISSSSWFLCK